MSPAARLRNFTGLASLTVIIPLLTTGCAAQDKLDQTVTANRSLREQLAAAEQNRIQSDADLRAIQDQLAETKQSYQALEARHDELNDSFDGLSAASDESMRRIAKLQIGPLPDEIETAIEDLAGAHPELLTFELQTGMVRFSSDFTFDLGSAVLKEDAITTLTALAGILNEPEAINLEARVIGHTDNVPIRRAETRRLHPTNTHLAVHRAIEVGQALIDAGVGPARIQVAGYGEYRPLVTNGIGGSATNRRVEIFLSVLPSGIAAPVTDHSAASDADRSGATIDPMK